MTWSRRHALVAVWTLPSAVLVAATALTFQAVRVPAPERLDDTARAAVMASLRAAVDAAAVPTTPPVHSEPTAQLALVATLWSSGRAIARADGRGAELAIATADAAAGLKTDRAIVALSPEARTVARIQVDVLAGTGLVAGTSSLLHAVTLPGITDTFAVQPGVDGVGADVGGRVVVLLPHELVAQRLLSAKRPSSTVAELAIGADLPRIEALLAARADMAGLPSGMFRFRTDAFVERPAGARDAPPLQLTRGVPPRPAVTAQALRDAALAGGRYLVAHLAANGRFVYEHDLASGRESDPNRTDGGDYSMPRHAGTTYFLSELYRVTGATWLREPIERALAHMIGLVERAGCSGTTAAGAAFECVLDHGEQVAQLGSSALGVVAIAEYQRATGDARYLGHARKLAEFLLYMQRGDGSFRHLYDPTSATPDDATQLLYYSGEASLALARMYAITGDARYADAARRGVDWLIDWYDFFLGELFYGEEHWTCIAAEALWPYARRDAYRAFCDGYAAFLRDQQTAVGDLPDADDLAGAYEVSAFVPPYNFAVGSRTEAMLSAYALDLDHGAAVPDTGAQIVAALDYLLGQQVRPDSDYAAAGAADGGVPGSPIDRVVRIDYVQHVCSALIRASVTPGLPLQSGDGGSAGR
jgi:hypothetical protein